MDILDFDNKYKHTEGSILRLLHGHYSTTAKYKISNIYIFKHDWETDFFIVQRASGYAYDIEVKVTKSDFYNDFNKKEKHRILKSGVYQTWRETFNTTTQEWERHHTEHNWNFRPNRFYYCVPKDMIPVTDVPPYAGLIYANEIGLTIVKEAPFIHKEKLKFESRLCYKLYCYWIDSKNELNRYKEYYKQAMEEIDYIKRVHAKEILK